MLISGSTEKISVPCGWNVEFGSYPEAQYVSVSLYTAEGAYAPRLLQAWGDDDVRVLDFYRVGVTDRPFIDRCIAEGAEPDLVAVA